MANNGGFSAIWSRGNLGISLQVSSSILYVTTADRDICRLTVLTPSVTQPTMSFQLPAGMRPAQAPQKGMSEEERAQQQQQQQQREEMKRQMIQAMLEPQARERREYSLMLVNSRGMQGALSLLTQMNWKGLAPSSWLDVRAWPKRADRPRLSPSVVCGEVLFTCDLRLPSECS